jgi:hypothetical protein
VLKETGLSGLAKMLLEKHVGIKRLNMTTPEDVSALETARAQRREEKAARAGKSNSADASKATQHDG